MTVASLPVLPSAPATPRRRLIAIARAAACLLRSAAAAPGFVVRAASHLWRNRRYLTFLKLLNMALVNVQYRLKTERVHGRPYKMKIESTNLCNTHCQLCPTGLGLRGRPKGMMKFEDFASLVDRFRRHLVALDLSMWGDPLIVPDIFRMIRHAHDRRIWTYLSSNLHAFKPELGHAEALVASGLDLLTCSLHAATQTAYEAYQPGKSLDLALRKIKHLLATRDRLRSRTPAIQLNFVVMRQNQHERAAFARLADSLGCKAVFSSPSANVRFLGLDRNLQSLSLSPEELALKTQQHLQRWLPDDPAHVLSPYQTLLRGQAFEPAQFNGRKLFNCSWPWRATVINWDGAVSPCCGSFAPGEDLGNVFQQPFSAIWNGRPYRLARRSFKKTVAEADAPSAFRGRASCPGYML